MEHKHEGSDMMAFIILSNAFLTLIFAYHCPHLNFFHLFVIDLFATPIPGKAGARTSCGEMLYVEGSGSPFLRMAAAPLCMAAPPHSRLCKKKERKRRRKRRRKRTRRKRKRRTGEKRVNTDMKKKEGGLPRRYERKNTLSVAASRAPR